MANQSCRSNPIMELNVAERRTSGDGFMVQLILGDSKAGSVSSSPFVPSDLPPKSPVAEENIGKRLLDSQCWTQNGVTGAVALAPPPSQRVEAIHHQVVAKARVMASDGDENTGFDIWRT